MLEASYCFASAATDGSLHVVRVQFSQQTSSPPKYKPLQVIREHRVDRMGEYISCMTHYNAGKTKCHYSGLYIYIVSVRNDVQPGICDDVVDGRNSRSQNNAHTSKHGRLKAARADYLHVY